MSWNELEPPGTKWDQQQTDTRTHTHTQIIGEYCVCSIIAQRKTTLPDAYLELNRTSTMKFFNCFHKKAPS